MNITRKLKQAVIGAVRSCEPLMTQAFSVAEKGSASDLVTSADRAVQERLRVLLGEILPQAGFLGEESPDRVQSELFWLVDPIDGTSNFVHGMRMSAISVALVQDGEAVLGVVYDPYAQEVFSACKGQGAFCNGERIHVSARDFSHALLYTAFSVYRKEFAPVCEQVLSDIFLRIDDFRRLGSAALELCHLAAGRGELYFELRLFPWDWSAAAVILREGGGVIGTIDGERLYHDRPSLVIAANNAANFSELRLPAAFRRCRMSDEAPVLHTA